MALSVVQNGGSVSGTGTSNTTALPSVAAGNLLVCRVCVLDDTVAGIVTVSDDKGNTWLQAASEFGPIHDQQSIIFYCLNAAAGTTTITVTFASPVEYDLTADEVTRTGGGTWTLDDASQLSETATTNHVCSATSGDIDTTAEAIVFCNSVRDAAAPSTFGTLMAGSGYTRISGSTNQVMWQHQVFPSAVADERGAFTSSGNFPAAATIAAFICTGSDCVPCWWPCCTECATESFFAFGGSLSSGLTTDNNEYDIGGDSWGLASSMPTPARIPQRSATIGTNCYAGGRGSGLSNDNDQYDSQGNTWSGKTDSSTPPRGNQSGSGQDADSYFNTSGADSGASTYYPDNDRYDEAGDSWSAKTDIVSPSRDSHSVFNISAKFYCVLGRSGSSTYIRDNDEYDISGDSWASKTNATAPDRSLPSPLSLSGLGYVVGGLDGTPTYYRDTDEYDASGDSWTAKTDVPSPARTSAGGASHDATTGYVCGGQTTGSTRIDDNDEYVPDVWASKTGGALANTQGMGYP